LKERLMFKQKMQRALLAAALLCVTPGCQSPYRGPDVLGPDQFVLDSYRIRQGKQSILELEGIPVIPLTASLLEPPAQSQAGTSVELIGKVACSKLLIEDQLYLFDALAMAKLAPDANLFASYVVRDEQALPVDMHRLVVLGDMSQNIALMGGDRIYIASPDQSAVMVMGEVTQQRVIPLKAPYISLREALATAGGLTFTGDRRHIQILRGNLQKPRYYNLSWLHIIHLPNDSLLLMPGDVVIVAATPIAEWGRFIRQLLPGPWFVNPGGTAGPYIGL